MSKPKGAAKAAPAKKRARKAVKDVVAPAVAEAAIEPTDWPPGLVEAEVEAFFRAVESGDHTVKTAATRMGTKGAEVYRLARKYPKFAARLEEAVDIGCLMAEDSYRDITASDRDSAAGANIKFQAIDRYLKVKRPKIYNTSTFKPVTDAGNEVVLGVIVVPAKQKTLPGDERFIDAEFKQIEGPEA
jgi:hypothetical protein